MNKELKMTRSVPTEICWYAVWFMSYGVLQVTCSNMTPVNISVTWSMRSWFC